MRVADIFETIQTWLPLDNIDNAEWIQLQWVEMILIICSIEVQNARKTGLRGNKRPRSNVAERIVLKARGNLPERPNTTFILLIGQGRNGRK
jgi:hypothetical protein